MNYSLGSSNNGGTLAAFNFEIYTSIFEVLIIRRKWRSEGTLHLGQKVILRYLRKKL